MLTRLSSELVLRDGGGRVMWEVPNADGTRLFVSAAKAISTPRYRALVQAELRTRLRDLMADADAMGLIDADPYWSRVHDAFSEE